MICPKCKELGQKSIIHSGMSYTTAMYCPSYYDENGNYHSHDMNSKTSNYYCSMGHNILVSPSNRCPNCDFGHDETITIKDMPSMADPFTISNNGMITINKDCTVIATIKGE